jgi:transposase
MHFFNEEAQLRAQCRALAQYAGMPQTSIAEKLNRSEGWVSKWTGVDNFEDATRPGRPRTALTPSNMEKLSQCRGKTRQSCAVVAKRLDIGKSSVSRGFLEQDLPALRRPRQSKMTENHEEMRMETAENFKDEPPQFWDDVMSTDEKIWTVNGSLNVQNDRVRAQSSEEVDPYDLDKFPAQRMSWLGISSKGHTGIKWMRGKVNGEYYRKNILKKVIVDDVLKRKGVGKKINRRKMFSSNKRMVFVQDWATPHSTNVNEKFMEKHFPNHSPTLHRFRGKHEYFFSPKMDDVWPIERVWGIMSQDVYREPRPVHIKAVMRRVREASLNLSERTLTKLMHQIPALLNEVYRLKGKKIPSNFDPSKSKHACKCDVCMS